MTQPVYSGISPEKEKMMIETPLTYLLALTKIMANNGVDPQTKASYIYDLVCRGVDVYLVREGLVQDVDKSGKSLGKKITQLQGNKHSEVVAAIKRFRSDHLRCEKTRSLDVSKVAGLSKLAEDVLSLCTLSGLTFCSRVPLEVRTISSVAIETKGGYRSFDVLHADAIKVPGDVLVISTHANPLERPTGQLVKVLQKEGILVDADRIHQVVTKGEIWTCFQEVEGHDTIHSVLTVRMKNSKRVDNPQAFFDLAVRGVFASIAALEHLGHRFEVVNLPVIHGQRIVDYPAAVDSLLKQAIIWLKKSDHTEKVNFIIYDSGELDIWDTALNAVLGRSIVTPGNNLVLEGITRELVNLLVRVIGGPLAGAANPLLQALERRDGICIENICVFGRKLCELLVSHVAGVHGLKTSPMLMNNIETLGQSKTVAPWICSYMHNLRIFGNETVHSREEIRYVPGKLDQNDLIVALCSLRSLLGFWQNEYSSAK
jgi:hypothetical protein